MQRTVNSGAFGEDSPAHPWVADRGVRMAIIAPVVAAEFGFAALVHADPTRAVIT